MNSKRAQFIRQPVDKKLNKQNIISKIERLQRDSVKPSASVDSAEQITGTTGELIVDRLIAPAPGATSMEPTGAGFTGSFMSGLGETFDSETYNVGGVRAGRLQAGFSQTDGSLIAAERLMKINSNGINFYSQGSAMQFAASETQSTTDERQGWFVGGLSTYMDGGLNSRFGVYSLAKNGNALIDDSFETGALSTDWVETGTPVVTNEQSVSGSYSCRVDKDNYISRSISVTAGSYYVISSKVRQTSAAGYYFNIGSPFLYLPTNAWATVFLLYRANSTTDVSISFRGWASGSTDPIYVDDVYVYCCDSMFSYAGDGLDGGGAYEVMGADAVSLEIGRNDGGGRLYLNSKMRDVDTEIYGTSTDPVLKVDAGANAAYLNGVNINELADGSTTALHTHAGGGDFILIEAKNMNSTDAASFDFQNIPATYKTLKLIVHVRSDRAAASDKINLKINNDATADNYQGFIASLKHSAGYNTEEFLGTTVPMPVGYATANTSPASCFAEYEYTFVDYANTNMNKSWQGRGGGRFNTTTGNIQMFDSVGEYLSTTAISRLTLTVNLGTNFKQYSTATLYGIK